MTTTSPLKITADDIVAEPFPHIVKDGILDHALYQRLRSEFPGSDVFDRNTNLGGRAGRDLYPGDDLYDEFINRSPAWKELHDYIVSPRFLDLTLQLFGPFMKPFECAVDPAAARFVDYVEPRSTLAEKGSRLRNVVNKMRHRLIRPAGTDDIFVRMDLAQGAKGYEKRVHCDRPNRLVSFLIYFCDADEIGLEGGDLVLFEYRRKRAPRAYERYPQPADTNEIARLQPKHNRGIFFLCSNNSYHGATTIQRQDRYREFVYISAASRAPWIW